MGNKCQSPSKTPNEHTGLSDYDIKLIKQSWAIVGKPGKLNSNAVEFFVQLFAKFPELQKYFHGMETLDEEGIKKSPKVRAHALSVMGMLSNYVANLDDPETLVALVTKVSEAHAARKLEVSDFEKLGSMFVPYLRSILGKKVTPDVEQAWTKLLGAQVAVYKATLESQNSKL